MWWTSSTLIMLQNTSSLVRTLSNTYSKSIAKSYPTRGCNWLTGESGLFRKLKSRIWCNMLGRTPIIWYIFTRLWRRKFTNRILTIITRPFFIFLIKVHRFPYKFTKNLFSKIRTTILWSISKNLCFLLRSLQFSKICWSLEIVLLGSMMKVPVLWWIIQYYFKYCL